MSQTFFLFFSLNLTIVNRLHFDWWRTLGILDNPIVRQTLFRRRPLQRVPREQGLDELARLVGDSGEILVVELKVEGSDALESFGFVLA